MMLLVASEEFDPHCVLKRQGQAAFLEGLSFGPKGTVNALLEVKDIGIPATRAAGAGTRGARLGPWEMSLGWCSGRVDESLETLHTFFDFQV